MRAWAVKRKVDNLLMIETISVNKKDCVKQYKEQYQRQFYTICAVEILEVKKIKFK